MLQSTVIASGSASNSGLDLVCDKKKNFRKQFRNAIIAHYTLII